FNAVGECIGEPLVRDSGAARPIPSAARYALHLDRCSKVLHPKVAGLTGPHLIASVDADTNAPARISLDRSLEEQQSAPLPGVPPRCGTDIASFPANV